MSSAKVGTNWSKTFDRVGGGSGVKFNSTKTQCIARPNATSCAVIYSQPSSAASFDNRRRHGTPQSCGARSGIAVTITHAFVIAGSAAVHRILLDLRKGRTQEGAKT